MISRIWGIWMLCLLLCTGAVAQAAPIKVACVGNSITYGTGLANPESESYPAILQTLLGKNYKVGNFGKPGATLLYKGHRPYVKQEEYQKAMKFAGDIVVIHLGVNDTDPRNWPNYSEEFVGNYYALIDSFRRVNPKCRILIARMTPIADRHPRFQSGTRDWHGEIQKAIETVAANKNVELIDFFAPLYPHPNILKDGIHPDANGAKILAKVVYNNITGDFGGLAMSSIYSDGMVLQYGKPLQIKGIANANELVTLKIAGRTYKTKATNDGKWQTVIDPLKVSGPYTLEISTKNKSLRYSDVLAGEVWLCSGQSNMAFPLNGSYRWKQGLRCADNPNLRIYNMMPRWRTDAVKWDKSVLDSLNNLQYYKPAKWESASTANDGSVSAVAYYFAKELQDSLKIPVGIICNSVGGSPIESWVDRSTLEYEFTPILRDWLHNDFIQDWVRGRAALNISASEDKLQRHPYEPCYLYEAGIECLDKYPIKGVIWYQGESNAHNKDAHSRLFKLLVDSWRNNWNDSSMPFYFVQLSSLNRPSWPSFRDSQRRLLSSIDNVGMAVCTDVGDSLDVHPIKKFEVGDRLARLALNNTYHFDKVTPSGPLVSKVYYGNDAVTVYFDYSKGMKAASGDKVVGFEVAGADMVYHNADVEIGDGCVKVYSPMVKRPISVRYAWQPFTRANLVNSDNLPASTFIDQKDCSAENSTDVELIKIEGTKNKDYDKGVSALYAGRVGDNLIMAGGCNFPDKPVAEGGKKKFYDYVYSADLSADALRFKQIGNLPQKLAYGVCVEVDNGLLIIGGNNENGSSSAVYRMEIKGGKPVFETLPSLPCGIDNMAGTVLNGKVYVVGGNQNGKASSAMYSMDLNNIKAGWAQETNVPGAGRVQPVCVAQNGNVYVFGGFAPKTDGKEAQVQTSCYSYNIYNKEWTECATPMTEEGTPITLSGGTGAAVYGNKIVCAGGVDATIFANALNGMYPSPEYLLHDASWYNFNKNIVEYDCSKGTWKILYNTNDAARAGAVMVGTGNRLFLLQGEIKPGIRTNHITEINIK